MTGADLLVRCLEREGVEYVFGVPGEETLDLNNALADSKIRFIATRHEQGAAFMADVYGRLTGRAGVCLATLGPGATNLATGLADANLDRAPVVAITGQASRDRMHKESHQHVNIVEAFGPFTKWNARVETGAVIPEVVRKAFKLAQEEKPGACHIELPEDVAEEPAEGEPLTVERARRPSPDRPSLARAAALINQAQRPLILAGNGVVRGRASTELRLLAERAGIAVVNTFMAKGIMPADHPQAVMTVGLGRGDAERAGFLEADLVIAVGYDPVEWGPRMWNPRRQVQIVHLDFTSAEVDAHYEPAVEVVADVREALELLAALVAPVDRQPPAKARRDDRGRSDAFPVLPQRVLADLEAALAPEDLVISDVGAHKLWVAKHYGARLPNTVIVSNGFAAMGIGLPGAIAAKLVFPERGVVTVTGDGGFLMNVQELETATRLGLPLVVLIFRDDGYGSIRWKQVQRFQRTAGVEFGNPDFVRLADAFGCRGFRVESAAEVAPIPEGGPRPSGPSGHRLPRRVPGERSAGRGVELPSGAKRISAASGHPGSVTTRLGTLLMQTITGDKRREGSVHGSRERVPAALFRAMAKLFLLKNPNSYREALALNLQARLAKCGVRYHHGTLRRQFGGAISSVPPEVETVMREILLEIHGLETVADIERALASSRLQVPPEKRLPLYISSDTVLRLAQLWLHLNPGKSKRFLACCLRQDLGREGVGQDLNSLQRLLAGKQDLARREVREKLLVYLAKHGVGSEAEALTLLQSQAQEIRRSLEDRGFVSSRRFRELCWVWQLRHREASSRRLAVLLQQKASERRVSINLHHLQALVDGKTRRVRRGILAALEDLLGEKFPGSQNLEEEIAKVSPQSPRMVDLTWVQAKPIATLARRWISQHRAFSRRQLAIRVSRTIRGMGYSSSHNTIQPILGGWKKRTRGFVYRAMLQQFDGGDRAQIPKQHIVKLGWTSESMAADMRAKTKIKRSPRLTVKSVVLPAWESVNPNLLKAVVWKTLNGMEREERDLFYERLLGALDQAAINVEPYLMMLGIPASTPHEVTPLEWGHLIRYFRVNVPPAMRAVADVLDEFPAFTHRTAEDCRLDLG